MHFEDLNEIETNKVKKNNTNKRRQYTHLW